MGSCFKVPLATTRHLHATNSDVPTAVYVLADQNTVGEEEISTMLGFSSANLKLVTVQRVNFISYIYVASRKNTGSNPVRLPAA